MPRVLAAADIGSNTVHLLVAEAGSNRLRRLANESVWLSLGEVVSRMALIPADVEDSLIVTLKRFRKMAEGLNAERLYVFATEAMRVALNHEEVLDRINRAVDIRVDLIPPTREAELSFAGTTLDIERKEPAIMVEVGGGSAQIAWINQGQILQQASLPIGTGRMIARYGVHSPCDATIIHELQLGIQRELAGVKFGRTAKMMIASGGVARGLVRALHPDGDPVLHEYELEYAATTAANLTPELLARRFGVKMKRAESMLAGATVYLEAMRAFDQEMLWVSEFGVREGAVLEMLQGAAAK